MSPVFTDAGGKDFSGEQRAREVWFVHTLMWMHPRSLSFTYYQHQSSQLNYFLWNSAPTWRVCSGAVFSSPPGQATEPGRQLLRGSRCRLLCRCRTYGNNRNGDGTALDFSPLRQGTNMQYNKAVIRLSCFHALSARSEGGEAAGHQTEAAVKCTTVLAECMQIHLLINCLITPRV